MKKFEERIKAFDDFELNLPEVVADAAKYFTN